MVEDTAKTAKLHRIIDGVCETHALTLAPAAGLFRMTESVTMPPPSSIRGYAMHAFPYVCPHCGANQFVSLGKGYAIEAGHKELELPGLPEIDGKKDLCIGYSLRASLCSRCLAPSIEIDVVLKEKDPTARVHGRAPTEAIRVGFGSTIKTYYGGRIYPDALIPIVHPSVPQALSEDYKEGWSILDRSPKSSAVLARRCVQGAIRDFCGIAKDTLNQEIDEVKRRYEEGSLGPLAPYVTHDLIEAIEGVRKVGNIGAHMEKNVNKIIPITCDEAKILLELVGTLFTEWYQAKSERDTRLQKLVAVAAKKTDAKRG